MLEARTQASVALFKLGAHSATPTLRPEFGGPKSLRCCCAKGCVSHDHASTSQSLSRFFASFRLPCAPRREGGGPLGDGNAGVDDGITHRRTLEGQHIHGVSYLPYPLHYLHASANAGHVPAPITVRPSSSLGSAAQRIVRSHLGSSSSSNRLLGQGFGGSGWRASAAASRSRSNAVGAPCTLRGMRWQAVPQNQGLWTLVGPAL